MRFLCQLGLFLLCFSPLVIKAQECEPLFEKPRIIKLLPGLATPLAIKPALPSDFVAGGPDGNPLVSERIYWGNKQVLNDFFLHPDDVKEPIIGLQISMNLNQQPEKGFTGEKELMQEMKSHGFKVMKSRKFSWGHYPVWAVQLLTPKDEVMHLAWVGLNAPHGSVLMFQMIYPKSYDKRRAQNISLWEDFLTKTSLLNDEAYFRANGMDLSEGVTIVDDVGVKMKITAERRQSDHKLLVIVKPLDASTEFELGEIKIGKMGGHLLRGRLITSVEGQITGCVNGRPHVITTHTTPVLIKDVDNYTINMKEVEANPRIQVFFQ